jgi:hypothetical protein
MLDPKRGPLIKRIYLYLNGCGVLLYLSVSSVVVAFALFFLLLEGGLL